MSPTIGRSILSRCIPIAAVLSATCLLTCGVSCAAAEPKASPTDVSSSTVKGDIVAALVLLLHDDSVCGELKLSKTQAAAVDKCLSEIDYPLWSVREATDEASKAGRERAFDHLEATLDAELTTSQRRRLDGIMLQSHGWPAVFAPRIAAELKLTADQLSRLRETLAENKMEPSGSGAQSAAIQKRIEETILTPEQRTRLKAMIGLRFETARIRKRYCRAPVFTTVDEWINSPPLDAKALEGKVVVVHFWAFGCVNCIRNLPHYQAWQEKLSGDEVVIVGMHTPETAAEKIPAEVRAKVAEFKIKYPVAIDGAAKNWNAWATRWWPSVYLVDKRGFVRYWWAGELNWQGTEGEVVMRRRIAELLAEKD